MSGFSLKKRPADTYIICALVLLTTGVFVGTSSSGASTGTKIVNAYLRDEIVHQMALNVDRTYLFYTAEQAANKDQYSDYLTWNEDGVKSVIDIANSETFYPNNLYYVLIEEENADLLLGPIVVDVNDAHIDVIAERSQHNYGSLMKPTDQMNWPLTCAPNFFRVIIEVME